MSCQHPLARQRVGRMAVFARVLRVRWCADCGSVLRQRELTLDERVGR